jgi:serine/threonine protein phosphatase PrpC
MPAKAEARVSKLVRAEAGAERALRVTTHGMTDRGQERSSNEDHFAIAHVQRVLRVSQSSLTQPEVLLGDQLGHLLVVADGMGGHQGGEYASALAVAGIENLLLNTISWLSRLKGAAVLDELRQALQITDRWVGEEARRTPGLRGMGTTLTMAFVTGRQLYVAHAGDSRCYRWRGGALERLTRDHTLVEQMVTEGMINAEEAAHHSMRNVVTNAVGGGHVGVDPEVHKHTTKAGDVILLCTDGLSGELSDEEIGAVLSRGAAPEQMCRELVDEANARGGPDNITVVIARFDEEAAVE